MRRQVQVPSVQSSEQQSLLKVHVAPAAPQPEVVEPMVVEPMVVEPMVVEPMVVEPMVVLPDDVVHRFQASATHAVRRFIPELVARMSRHVKPSAQRAPIPTSRNDEHRAMHRQVPSANRIEVPSMQFRGDDGMSHACPMPQLRQLKGLEDNDQSPLQEPLVVVPDVVLPIVVLVVVLVPDVVLPIVVLVVVLVPIVVLPIVVLPIVVLPIVVLPIVVLPIVVLVPAVVLPDVVVPGPALAPHAVSKPSARRGERNACMKMISLNEDIFGGR